jgi:hypothetical protein
MHLDFLRANLKLFNGKHLLAIKCFILGCSIIWPAIADTSASQDKNGIFVWKGQLTKERLNSFLESSYTAIEFKESSGSPSSAGVILDALEKQIESRGLTTYANGYCSSTCAYAFLFGKTRILLKSESNERTYLMLHAFRDSTSKEINYGLTDRNFQRIVSKSGGKISLSLLERIYDDKNGTGAGELYIFREPFVTKRGASHVLFCPDPKNRFLDQCEPILGVDLNSLGISIDEGLVGQK